MATTILFDNAPLLDMTLPFFIFIQGIAEKSLNSTSGGSHHFLSANSRW
jgi:hypothetical protein